jgi:uncharacterized protein (TIGR02271 family)
MATTSDVLSWRGQDALDADGDKIGTIEEIYLDADSNEPEWALINTGLFGTKRSFVPLRGASPAAEGEGIRVAYDKATVKDAPKVDPDGLSREEEAELYRHYGRDYGGDTTRGGDEGDPTRGAGETTRGDYEGDPTRGAGETTGGDYEGDPTRSAGETTRGDYEGETVRGDRGRGDVDAGDDAMTRSEEELRVGTARREAGRARLKKYVVEEEVTQTVPVRREEVRVEREPITDENRDAAMAGPEITEAEHEVVLHAEEPVTEKRAVPKERVRLEKDVHEDEHEVSDTVRKERFDVDDSGEVS